MTKHQKEIKLFKHAPVRPFWKLKTFFFCYLQWHDWSGLAFWSWFWQFTWDQLLWFPVASQQIPIGSTFVTFVKSWDLFHKEITFCFRTMALNTVLNRPPYEQNFPAHLSKYLSHTRWRILSSKLFTFSPFWETAKNVSGVAIFVKRPMKPLGKIFRTQKTDCKNIFFSELQELENRANLANLVVLAKFGFISS